eukprot:94086_1
MADPVLPVPQNELQQAIHDIMDSEDLSSMKPAIMRSKLEHKFKLQDGELSNHRSLLSSLMDQYIDNINANLEASDLNELDSYINNNKNHNNRNNNKNHNNPKSNKTKTNINQLNQSDIMDINYTDPSNSSLYHIYTDSNGIKYSIMLNQTDISYGQRGHNKFYAIQLLEHNHRGTQYKFINKWGRVGNTPNSNEVYIDQQALAIAKFRKKFKDKTKNDFGTRHFNAFKGKYIPITMQNNAIEAESTVNTTSKLKLSGRKRLRDPLKSDSKAIIAAHPKKKRFKSNNNIKSTLEEIQELQNKRDEAISKLKKNHAKKVKSVEASWEKKMCKKKKTAKKLIEENGQKMCTDCCKAINTNEILNCSGYECDAELGDCCGIMCEWNGCDSLFCGNCVEDEVETGKCGSRLCIDCAEWDYNYYGRDPVCSCRKCR